MEKYNKELNLFFLLAYFQCNIFVIVVTEMS